jgi:hypothetical protein
VEDQKHVDLIEVSDITELEEIFNKQKKDGLLKTEEAKFVPAPKLFQKTTVSPQVEVTSPEVFEPVSPILEPVLQPITSQPIMAEPIPIASKAVAPRSIDQFILDTAEAMKQAKIQKAEDEKIEFINSSYQKIFTALTAMPNSPRQPEPTKPFASPSQETIKNEQSLPEEDLLPKGKLFKAKPQKETAQKNSSSVGTVIKAGLLCFAAGISVVIIVIHFFGG